MMILMFTLGLQNGVDHLAAAVHSHLLKDVVDMVFDCVVRNEKQVFDLLVAFSLQDELHDLALPVGDLECFAEPLQELCALLR